MLSMADHLSISLDSHLLPEPIAMPTSAALSACKILCKFDGFVIGLAERTNRSIVNPVTNHGYNTPRIEFATDNSKTRVGPLHSHLLQPSHFLRLLQCDRH